MRVTGQDADAAPAITTRHLVARLDAIVRRMGGVPKPIERIRGRVILPAVSRRNCPGQLELDYQ